MFEDSIEQLANASRTRVNNFDVMEAHIGWISKGQVNSQVSGILVAPVILRIGHLYFGELIDLNLLFLGVLGVVDVAVFRIFLVLQSLEIVPCVGVLMENG